MNTHPTSHRSYFAASPATTSQAAVVYPASQRQAFAPRANNPAVADNITFPVAHLAAYGIAPEAIACLARAGMHQLLPLQRDAVMTTGLLRGANIVALAPTSAGKTFLGELAAVRQFEAGRKSIFLAPTRALAAEQFRHLRERYGPMCARVILSTADHTRHDKRFRTGDYDFAVMVYEKFRAFIISAPEVLYTIGAVVADELQILSDTERGETADLLLTRLTQDDAAIQVIGLSAVADNGDQLAAWLNAELLTSTTRPAELREGIYCLEHGAFHYHNAATGQMTDEQIFSDSLPAPALGASSGAAALAPGGVVQLCAALARAGESCLVFVPTRPMSRQLCMEIAAELGIQTPSDSGATTEDLWTDLRNTEESVTRRQLMESVPAGVAFHNSDLTADLRAMVEQAFDSGALRVLVATPTLAQGVNLRAKNVIQVPLMLHSDTAATQQRPAHVPLSVSRYRNQAGRAGRVGSGHSFGRSILIAYSHIEAVRLSRTYLNSPPEPIQRAFSNHNLEHFILSSVHSGSADNWSTLFHALTHSFACHSGSACTDVAMEDRLSESIRALLDLELLTESGGHRLRLTGIGQAMAAGGFQSTTMGELVAMATQWRGDAGPAPFETLCACAFTADGESFPMTATVAEVRSNLWLRAARECLAADGATTGDTLLAMLDPAGGLSSAGHSCLKKVVLAHAWIGRQATADIEEKYHVVAGTVASLAAHLAWIMGGLTACASVLQCPDAARQSLVRLGQRLPLGLTNEAADLSQLHIPGLSRQYLHRLADEGFDSVQVIRRSPVQALSRAVPSALAERIKAEIGGSNRKAAAAPQSTEVESCDAAHEASPPTFAEPQSASALTPYDLELDGNDPGHALFHGKTLRLSPKPYALLCLLARHCGRTVAYQTIDEQVWPDEKVEPQQISAHKSRLIKELARATSPAAAEAAIKTDPRYGLRLNLPAERVILTETQIAPEK